MFLGVSLLQKLLVLNLFSRDADETSVSFLRMEIQKLRGGTNMDDEEMDDERVCFENRVSFH